MPITLRSHPPTPGPPPSSLLQPMQFHRRVMSQLGVGEGITRWQVFLSQSLCQTVHREHAPATETQPALGCGVGAIYIGIPQPRLGSGVAAVFITTQQCCLGIAHPTLGQLFPCPWCLWKQKAAICYMGELGTSPSLSYSAPGQLRPQARQRKEAALSASPPPPWHWLPITGAPSLHSKASGCDVGGRGMQ